MTTSSARELPAEEPRLEDRQPPVRGPLPPWLCGLSFVVVILPGFVTLAVLGTVYDHPPRLPGFWDYPSGTIGDGLLLPGLVVALIYQVHALRPADHKDSPDRVIAAIGFLIGALGGAAVPASWVLSSNARRIWMLTRARDFDLAGWIHLIYATVTTGLIVALLCLLTSRLRRSSLAKERAGISPPAMTLIVGAGLGMLVLIGRDAVVGGQTASSALTLSLLALAAVGFLGALLWAEAGVRLRPLLYPGFLILSFVCGLIALIVGWPPQYPAITLLGWLAAALIATGALTMLSHEPGHRFRWIVAAVCAVLLAAGLVRAEDAMASGSHRPLLWGLAGALASSLVLALSANDRHKLARASRYGLFAAYCLVLFYLAAHLQTGRRAARSAAPSLAVADTAFDLMVFALIQTRFARMAEQDRMMMEKEYVTEDDPWVKSGCPCQKGRASGDDGSASNEDQGLMGELVLLGFAVGIGLFTLLTTAAGPLHLNRHTVSPSPVRIALPLGALAVSLVALGGLTSIVRWRRSADEPRDGVKVRELSLPSWYWCFPALAAIVWGAAFIPLTGGPPHLGLLGVGVGLVMLVLYGKSLSFMAFGAQTLGASVGQRVLAWMIALVLAAANAWMLSMGLWQGQSALSGWWLAATAVAVFVGNFALFVVTADTFARGLPGQLPGHPYQQMLAREVVGRYAILDGAVFGLNFLICVTLPLYAATRDETLHGSALNVLASMFFLPGLLTAVIWGLENWHTVDKLTRRTVLTRVSKTMLLRSDLRWETAVDQERQRAKALHWDWTIKRYGTFGLMAMGLGYLAVVLLSR